MTFRLSHIWKPVISEKIKINNLLKNQTYRNLRISKKVNPMMSRDRYQ